MSTIFITDTEIFSRRLKTLRNGRKKVEFAAFIGTSPQNYGRYESGRIPDTVTVSDIANRCGVTVDWLLGRDDSAPPNLAVELPCTPARKFEKGQESVKGELPCTPARKLEKGQESVKGELPCRGAVKLQKGQGAAVCRYPESCDLGGELAAVRERMADTNARMAEVEATLSHMSIQLETVVGLLGSALSSGLNGGTRPREEKRKAG